MHIVYALDQIPAVHAPRGLAIGSFDGVHLGHAALFRILREKVSSQGTVAALTFLKHPSAVLAHCKPVKLICNLEHKLELFEALGIDLAIVIEFNDELVQTPYDTFLRQVHQAYPFEWLVRGKGSALGKNRQGDEANITELGRRVGFETLFQPLFTLGGESVSSGVIRRSIEEGNLAKASFFLGRPYSIYAHFTEGAIDLSEQCCPPNGEYETSHGPASIHNRLLTCDTLNGWHHIIFKT